MHVEAVSRDSCHSVIDVCGVFVVGLCAPAPARPAAAKTQEDRDMEELMAFAS